MYAEGDGLARILGQVKCRQAQERGLPDVQAQFFPTNRTGLPAASAAHYARLGETFSSIWKVLPFPALLTPIPTERAE